MTFHHASGIQVVLEDYVHNELVKMATIVAAKFLCFALAVAGSSPFSRLHSEAEAAMATAYQIIDHTYDVVVVEPAEPACGPPSAWRKKA